MNRQLKNYSFLNKRSICFWLICLSFSVTNAQTANHISNGSFESYYDCDFPYRLEKAKHWLSIDSTSYGGMFYSTCNNKVPNNASGHQFPRTGIAYAISNFYFPTGPRGYLKNRLKANLDLGKTYCVKFYVNICNQSTYGIDQIGIYFGDASIDTITKCNVPLTFLIPQVKNLQGNVIGDTLNWTAISGTFIATGTEKYALIGNFSSNAATTSTVSNPGNLPLAFTDLLVDDVSCIDLNLPSFAGRDTSALTGSTVYIGRPRDVGIDEACTWYQLPNTTSVIATGAGLTVNAVGSSTYMVRQEICGNVKWDTVVVKEDPVGIRNLNNLESKFILYPNPASTQLIIETQRPDQQLTITISDLSGRNINTKSLHSEGSTVKLDLDLSNGVYLVKIENETHETVVKKLLIAK